MQILKLGGSAITKKDGYMVAAGESISNLASAVSEAWHAGVRDLILVHGAGSFGHTHVLNYGIRNGIKGERQHLGFAHTHVSCSHLSGMVVDALIRHGVPAVSIPPAVVIRQKGGRISKFDTKIISSYLSAGYLPVLYGDIVLDEKMGGSVCSGDQIVAYLGRKAKRIVLASNVEGILAEGKLVPQINRRNFPQIKKYLGAASSPDVTGGMAGKIAELLKVKTPAFVVNANKPERVKALLLGKKAICTEIRF